MKGNWFVKTLDTTAEIVNRGGEIWLDGMTIGNENRIIPRKLALPEFYSKNGGEAVRFKWELRREFDYGDKTELGLYDDEAGCAYKITISGRCDIKGPVEFSGNLTNTGAKEIRIWPDKIFAAWFAFNETPRSWRFMKESGLAENVRWYLDKNTFYPGSGIYKDILNEGISVEAETTTNQDFNSGGMIPIIYLDGGSYGSYAALEWASGRITASGKADGVEISVDLRENFNTLVQPGDELMIPPVYIGVYSGDIDDGSNIFKRWFFLEKTPKVMLRDKNEPYTQMDQQIDLNAEGLGIQSVKWDYGWWSDKKLEADSGDIWKYHEGSWKLRDQGYKALIKRCGCESMKEFGEKVKKTGFNWTVYVLLHDSQCELGEDEGMTSVGENAHPEWFSDRKIGGKCPVCDLGNRECVEYCKRKLYEFFTENNIGTWRSDFEPIAHYSDKRNRHDANGNDVQYWCSRGFYDIVDYLIEAIPGFRYESCSSGGSMKDFATMRRAAVFNNDDSADYVSLRTTFYDSSYCFPPAQLQAPTNPDTFCPDCPRHYAGIGDKDYGFRSIITGAVMLGSWCGTGPDGHLRYDLEKYYAKYLNLYNEKIKPLVRDANLYHIMPRPDNIHWDGMQYGCDYITENGICGVCFLFKPTETDGSTKRIKARGLNPDYIYKAEFYQRPYQNFEATGKSLMETGFDCTIEESCGSELVFFIIK